MSDPDEAALDWLLTSDEPGIRYRTRTELLDEDPNDRELIGLAHRIAEGPKCHALLQFQDVPPYKKWSGAHWRLASLVELGVGEGHPAADRACDFILDCWASDRWLRSPHVVDGLVRAHASVFGNALAVACRLGVARDARAERLASALCDWQWPDGGWNCDPCATHRSSFHESLATAWGLIEYHRSRGEPRAEEAAKRAAELFLAHRLFRNSSTGEVIHPSFVKFHWPPYWHYDVLQALRVLSIIGVALRDERAADAFDLLDAKRLSTGRWRPGGRWWATPRFRERDTGCRGVGGGTGSRRRSRGRCSRLDDDGGRDDHPQRTMGAQDSQCGLNGCGLVRPTRRPILTTQAQRGADEAEPFRS